MASARSAFAASSDARQIRIFESKKLPGIRFFPVKLEIPRQPTPVGAQLSQKILSAWLPRHAKLARSGDVNFNFVAFLEPQGLHHNSRKPDGETVAPFRDLHVSLLGYTWRRMYIHHLWPIKDTPVLASEIAFGAATGSAVTRPRARALRIREAPSSIFCRPASWVLRCGSPWR